MITDNKGHILLLCEKTDTAQFINFYIKYLRQHDKEIPQVRIINFAGVDSLADVLSKVHEQDWFHSIKKIVLFADGTAKRRDREHLLYKIEQHTYLKYFADYSYYLFPYKSAAGNWQPGFLEDVLLETLNKETSESCAYQSLYNITEDFLLSVNNTRGKEHHFTNHSRQFLCMYLSGTKKYAGLKLAEAAQKGAFDLESSKFEDLKKVICGLN